MPSYTPILHRYKAWQIKEIIMANKRLVCVLTTTGQLDMYNASNVEESTKKKRVRIKGYAKGVHMPMTRWTGHYNMQWIMPSWFWSK